MSLTTGEYLSIVGARHPWRMTVESGGWARLILAGLGDGALLSSQIVLRLQVYDAGFFPYHVSREEGGEEVCRRPD